VDEQQAEIRRLRDLLAVVRGEARENEAIFRRSHERYLRLLQAGSLGELFDAIVNGLRRDCELDAVTLVVRDLRHEIRQLLHAEDPHAEPPEGLMFRESLEGLAPQYNTLWQPWLGRLVGADHSLIFPHRSDLGSCALLPLRRGEELIGVLNFGSRDPVRFTRHHGVDFLRHLADIAAVCLENAVNRSRLVRSGITDVLTGLYNRRYLQHRLVDELTRARRDRRPLACMMLDVDHFKPVNDQWGHPAGDKVLAQIAHTIREECRASDIPIRYGGEEFAMLLPGADASEAMAVAERIRAAVAAGEFALPEGQVLRLTVSAGVSCARPGERDADLKSLGERLIAEADVQLYRAKSEGRDRVCGAAA
jgi:two-component system, cell cycle response regulator